MPRDLEYEENNIGYDGIQYTVENGGGIKCNNYELCKGLSAPDCGWERRGNYLCLNCDMFFNSKAVYGEGITLKEGKLEFSDNNFECIVCYEPNKRSITLLKCNHKMCIECFKRCHYGDENLDNEPEFPYPEIEEEYYDDIDTSRWDNDPDYPLIKSYNEEWNKWDDARELNRSRETYLKVCPLCRK